MRYFLFPISLLLLATACSRTPDIYQPPIQRKPLTGPEGHLGQFVNMSDLAADAFLVSDFSRATEAGSWRWAYRHPRMRFYLLGVDGLHFVMDAGAAESTFPDTGPVTLSIQINGREFDRILYDKPGQRHYDKRVPVSLLQPHSENFVSFETDKQWVSKEDGAVLSFVLSRAGFVRQ